MLNSFLNSTSLSNFVKNNFQTLLDFLLDKFFIYDKSFENTLSKLPHDYAIKISQNLKNDNLKERQILEHLANLTYRYGDFFNFCQFCNALDLNQNIPLKTLNKLSKKQDLDTSFSMFKEALKVFDELYQNEPNNVVFVNYIVSNFIYIKLSSRKNNNIFFVKTFNRLRSFLNENYSFLDREFFNNIFYFSLSNPNEFLDNHLKQINLYLNPNCNLNVKVDCEISNYACDLQNFGCITFNDILKYAQYYYRNNIGDENTRYYNLNRGKAILDHEDDLFQYIHSFGAMHQKKLLTAFNNAKQYLVNYKECRVIDYACGQGMGIMNLIDFLNNNKFNINIKEIILIEPSQKALARAILHLKYFVKNSEIKSICKYLNDLNLNDLLGDNIPTIHIFSNILDMNEVKLNSSLYDAIKSSFGDKNLFFCVSPYGIANDRLNLFYEYFKEKFNAAQISNEIWQTKPTKYEQIFEVIK